ncbi:hypothetical protein [Nocardiopsis lucentensis]|uniref:hypothetical protein n=1 Tax=Nocardiopsis lucentensis TaxID=53441 RepID=UPI0003466F36|nr:hypothetical protein [Nocardiopsis lucentensis]
MTALITIAVLALAAGIGGTLAVVIAWRHGALEDERARSARLESELIEANRIIRRLSSGTDDIIRAARGTHHRQEEPRRKEDL